MAEKDFNYNITQTFYAKWILPFVLIILGTILIIIFQPGTKFMKGKDYDTKEERVFYKVTIDNEIKYVEVKEKTIFIEKEKGSYTYYLNTNETYTKHVPWYSPVRMNLAQMGLAGGVGLTVVGIFMLVINIFNKVSKISPKKKNELENKGNEENDEEDDE
jgi:hypothetical protein